MDAVVMAGGFGRRLGLGEKGMVHVLGKPLLEYVLTALTGAEHIDNIFVATSKNTPETHRWVYEKYCDVDNYDDDCCDEKYDDGVCRDGKCCDGACRDEKFAGCGRIIPLRTPGSGFVADLVYAAAKARIDAPFFIIMSDIMLITPQLIDMVIDIYDRCDTQALSTYVPLDVCTSIGIRPDTVFHKDGKIIVPVGVNILDGRFMDREQSDYNLISGRQEFAVNINTVDDLKICEQMLTERLMDGLPDEKGL